MKFAIALTFLALLAPAQDRVAEALRKGIIEEESNHNLTAAIQAYESLLKQAAAETGERASDLRSQVESKLLSAKLKLQDLQEDAVDRAKAAAKVTDDYVRDNPWQAIGAAAAVGFLVGVLVSRR